MESFAHKRSAPLILLEETESTNTLLKKMAMEGAVPGTVVAARRQTSGRGRMGRSFVSPEGGLYLSMLLEPPFSPQDNLSLTPCTAVAAVRAVKRLCGIEPDIKWPNDLLLEGKKLCGILCESLFFQERQFVILGLGLNLNTEAHAFPEELGDLACSLFTQLGKSFPADEALAVLICELDEMYARWLCDRGCFLDEYRRKCISCGRDVLLIKDGASLCAFAEGIDENYAISVRYPDGRRESIYTGEVSLR